MFQPHLLLLLSIFIAMSASKPLRNPISKPQMPLRESEYNELSDELEMERDSEMKPSRFVRVARVPLDFSFNSDLTLLRKMLSESRPQGYKLLAFGK
ncbi:unnamed protein product [Hymenolepis diminuta]|uniref:Uncharacterized protein n=2 Tax=Hymenolepis diminuta TaxID=6216 RepID=A0A564Z8H9_HYMDI|nr:unnamed protein product [Hymenolepis diminuta]